MNWKFTKAKTIVSVIVGALLFFATWVFTRGCTLLGGPPGINTCHSDYEASVVLLLFGLVVVYLIWSLVQRNSNS